MPKKILSLIDKTKRLGTKNQNKGHGEMFIRDSEQKHHPTTEMCKYITIIMKALDKNVRTKIMLPAFYCIF